MIRRTTIHRRSRAKLLKPYIPRSHDSLLAIALGAPNTIICTASERIIVARNNATGALILPQYLVQSVAPLSIAVLGPNSFALSYSAAAPSDALAIPAQDPAVRNYTGGFMTQLSTSLPADIIPSSLVGDDIAETVIITTPVPITVISNAAGYTLTPLLGVPVAPDTTVQSGPAEYTLTFPAGTNPVGGSLAIPAQDPSVRGLDGAYIAANAYAVT